MDKKKLEKTLKFVVFHAAERPLTAVQIAQNFLGLNLPRKLLKLTNVAIKHKGAVNPVVWKLLPLVYLAYLGK